MTDVTVPMAIDLLKEYSNIVIEFLQRKAWLLYIGIAILPTFMFPISPLMIVSGTVFAGGENAPIACVIAVSATMINMAWTYWVAAYPCHTIISKILKNSKFKVPKASGNKDFQLVAVVRLTGMPFPFQNFALGLSRMNFLKYMLFSVLIQGPVLSAFVYFGDAITQGKGKVIFLSLAIIVLLSVALNLIPKYIKNKRNAATAIGPDIID